MAVLLHEQVSRPVEAELRSSPHVDPRRRLEFARSVTRPTRTLNDLVDEWWG
jgi:hypothetical protein